MANMPGGNAADSTDRFSWLPVSNIARQPRSCNASYEVFRNCLFLSVYCCEPRVNTIGAVPERMKHPSPGTRGDTASPNQLLRHDQTIDILGQTELEPERGALEAVPTSS
jgi:hypothetical protein